MHQCVCVCVCASFPIFRKVSKHLWLNQHDVRFGENMWCTVIQHGAVRKQRDTLSVNWEGGLSHCQCPPVCLAAIGALTLLHIIGAIKALRLEWHCVLLKPNWEFSFLSLGTDWSCKLNMYSGKKPMNSDTVRSKSGLSHVKTNWMWPKYLQMRLLSKQTYLIFSDLVAAVDNLLRPVELHF